MDSIIEDIKIKAKSLFPAIQSWRRHFHQHPELSFKEYKTADYIRQRLIEIGISKIETMATTGVIAYIEGRNPNKKCIALRADMDALPIEELKDSAYRSINPGVMHACGHDVHSACLLGAAEILHSIREKFEGTIKLIFQPGEEKLPGGASILIKEGVLENPKPHSIFGQHVMPLLECGKIGFRSGLYMASTDELYITITGKGGHGAMPHLCKDPVMMAAQMLVQLQQIISRNANPIVPSVLSFGKIIANGATNVIPDTVYIEGTFRTLNEKWRNEAHELMKGLATSLIESMGGNIDFDIRKGYPFLQNDPTLTAFAKECATSYMGAENIVDLDIWMAAEDFAYYSQEMPACFYRLGTRNESMGITSGVHTATFDVDEKSLEIGSGLMAWIAFQEITKS